jgi:hypothetical protein
MHGYQWRSFRWARLFIGGFSPKLSTDVIVGMTERPYYPTNEQTRWGDY